MSRSQRNGTPRNSIVFWNTKNSAKNTGIGISIGKHPENELNGLIPCSLYTRMISACCFCGSLLYFFCTSVSSGWMRCILMLVRIAPWLSGHISRRTLTPKITSTQP